MFGDAVVERTKPNPIPNAVSLFAIGKIKNCQFDLVVNGIIKYKELSNKSSFPKVKNRNIHI